MQRHHRLRFNLEGLIDRWPDLIGALLIMLGLGGKITGSVAYPPISSLAEFYHDISTELLGIGLTVLIIDKANKKVAERAEKKRLILQMGSPDNGFAVEAVRMLGASEWLYDGSLRKANLKEANLDRANLSRSDLSEADLYRANLRGANLIEANLFKTNLIGANLSEADLSGANLSKAILLNANMRDAIVTNMQLRQAESLENATLPNGKKYKALPGDIGMEMES